MRTMLLPVLFVGLLTATAHGNPVALNPKPVAGPRSIAPEQKTSVALVKELVEVKLGVQKAHVKGTYWLTNTSDKAEHVKVGFPDLPAANLQSRQTGLMELKVSVAGEKVDYGYERTGYENGVAMGWFVWVMDFEPGQERVLAVEYDTTVVSPREGHPLENEPGTFRYWLHTGAAWKGRIKDAVIRVEVAPEARDRIARLRPSGASWQDDTITWEFESIEPTSFHDIEIDYGVKGRRLSTYLSVDEITDILKDPAHPQFEEARSAAASFGAREMLTAAVEAAARKRAAKEAESAEEE